tara:strand:+ start:9359 stop:10891 length:1533 start_codon:yes stop_codon:yes gene_type:complete
MVKIIRLSTDSTDGSFNTRFNAPVNIKPYSKIALQNLVMGVNLKEITVNASNDQINFQITNGNVRTCNLTRKTYTDNDALDIVDDIQKQMNGSLVFTGGKELGAQFLCSHASRITIQNAFSRTSAYTPQFNSNIPSNTAGQQVVDMSSATNPNFIMNRSAGLAAGASSTDNQAINFLDQTICKGTGFFRFKLHTLVDEATTQKSGFIIGLCKGEVSKVLNGVSDPTTFSDNNIYFGIHVKKLGDNMTLISEGQSIATAHSPNSLGMYVNAGSGDNAIVEIKVHQNKMEAMVYYNGGQQSLGTKTVNLNGTDMNIQKQVYTPFIIYRGSATNVKSVNHKFIQDPFTPIPKDFVEHVEDLGAPTPPTQRGGGATLQTQQFIEIVDVEFARTLGFVPNRLPTAGTQLAIKLVFTASQDFSLIALNDNFMALLDNVYLDSYDSLLKGHRPIVAVIPSADDVGVIRYDSNYPVFVDCNNKNGISLQNIKLRIIRQDGSNVVSQGLSTATLLIDEK